MALADIAAELARAVPDVDDDLSLRACLSNLLIGIRRRHIQLDSANRRLAFMMTGFREYGPPDHTGLLTAYLAAMLAFDDADDYQRPGPISQWLDEPAVTIQANEDGLLGRYWLGRRASAEDIVAAFSSGHRSGQVGAPKRPLWFTPYVGEIKSLCITASNPACPDDLRAEIARRLVATLGLAHIHTGDEILALVTHQTIRDLHFNHPGSGKPHAPTGSTALEARGHRRFRPWPAPILPDTYGRTYELDGAIRARHSVRNDHGLPEAVRPALSLADFASCIFVGPLRDARFDDTQLAFLGQIGANISCDALLVHLASETGL
jgi:hypothetical protein